MLIFVEFQFCFNAGLKKYKQFNYRESLYVLASLYIAVPFIPHNQQYNGTTIPSWHMRKHSPRG